MVYRQMFRATRRIAGDAGNRLLHIILQLEFHVPFWHGALVPWTLQVTPHGRPTLVFPCSCLGRVVLASVIQSQFGRGDTTD